MFTQLRAFLTVFFITFSSFCFAESLPNLEVTVLQSGTVNWELEYVKKQQLDKVNGFRLSINRVASLSAARLALTSESTDMIVSDWLWAGRRNNDGDSLRFVPFSSQIGSIILGKGVNLKALEDLKGKRIGVAGGPLNKGWVLLRAAAKKAGLDLQKDTEIQFGAPPLLSQALKRGQVDILVTFWHYGARLEAEGYSNWMTLESLMQELGMKSNVPMLGYLFKNDLLVNNAQLVDGFAKAISQAKQKLLHDDMGWVSLKPIMKAENNLIYQALKSGYRSGIPAQISSEQVTDVVKFYNLIDSLSANPTGKSLNPELFYGTSE